MAYYQNNGRGRNYNNGGGYRGNYNNNGGGYNRNYNNGGGYGNGGRPKKHSGASKGMTNPRNGGESVPFVRGWNTNKTHGMRSFFACPYAKTDKHKSKSGKVWYNWMVRIQQQGAPEQIVSGLYEEATGRVIIKELQMVINPNKDYCGTYVRRKN